MTSSHSSLLLFFLILFPCWFQSSTPPLCHHSSTPSLTLIRSLPEHCVMHLGGWEPREILDRDVGGGDRRAWGFKHHQQTQLHPVPGTLRPPPQIQFFKVVLLCSGMAEPQRNSQWSGTKMSPPPRTEPTSGHEISSSHNNGAVSERSPFQSF